MKPYVLVIDDDGERVVRLKRRWRSRCNLVVSSPLGRATLELRRWQWWTALIVSQESPQGKEEPDRLGATEVFALLGRAWYALVPVAVMGESRRGIRDWMTGDNIVFVPSRDEAELDVFLQRNVSQGSVLPPPERPLRRGVAELILRYDLTYLQGKVLFVQAESWTRGRVVRTEQECLRLLGIRSHTYREQVRVILGETQTSSLDNLFRYLESVAPGGERSRRVSGTVSRDEDVESGIPYGDPDVRGS